MSITTNGTANGGIGNDKTNEMQFTPQFGANNKKLKCDSVKDQDQVCSQTEKTSKLGNDSV